MAGLDTFLENDIRTELDKTHLKYRIFSRIKKGESITEKITRKHYQKGGRILQDLIGIRITTYFTDDMEIVSFVLKALFELVEEVVDFPDPYTFKPKRRNYVFKIPEAYQAFFIEHCREFIGLVDSTFEVQIRTVFSEGWHEIEHDYHYKPIVENSSWKNETERRLNSIIATLELCEQNLLSVLSDCAIEFNDNNQFEAALCNYLHIELKRMDFPSEVLTKLQKDKNTTKRMLLVDRKTFLITLYDNRINLPPTLSNYFFALSAFCGVDEFENDEPSIFSHEFNRLRELGKSQITNNEL